MKQSLLNLTQVLVPVKRKFLVSIFLLVFGSVFSQNAIVGTGFSSGWGGGGCPTGNLDFKFLAGNAGVTYGVTTTANGTGVQLFRFGVDWGGTTAQLAISPGSDVDVVPNTTYSLNTNCTTSGAMKYNVPNTSYNYVFKTLDAGSSPTGKFVFFEVQGAVRSVSTVTQSPLAASVTECHAITVTATLDGALSPGQAVYMRYTKDGYVNSTVVQLTGDGTTYMGTIPSSFNTAAANVSYYVFTSGTTTPSGADADLYTINLNNNGAANYSYTVAAGGGTTYVPDNNFEQALITLGLDCALDDYVFTSNISNLTELNIEGKAITNLTGIEAFSSLQDLYCKDNNLTSLDVSMLSNLRFLDLENNSLTSLNIKGLNNLTQVICWFNNLTTLDLSDTPNLVYLDCDFNDFTSLDVSKLTHLVDFYCSGNQLTSMDVRGLTDLDYFECTENALLTCILVDDLEAANAKTIADQWVKDVAANYSYCACNLTTTWDGASWIPVAPTTGTYAAIIAGNYSEPANISACTLTIKNGATAIIPSGFNVALNAPLTVETGGSFTLSNNANLIQSTNTANTGNVVVKRNSNPLYRLDYTMWSSPVASQNLSAFSPLTTLTRFYTYNPATNLYNAIPDPSATNFTSGTGYLIRMPNTDPASGYDAGTNSIIYPGVFTGVPNTGNVSLASLSSGQYYAVGNPYPSPISAESFLAGNSTDGILYFWRKTNAALGSAYATYTAGGSTTTTPTSAAPNGTIAVGQGFIVKTGVTTTLNFTNAMREVSPTSTQFFKTRQVVEKDRVWLNLTNTTGVFSQMLVGYMTNATQGVDAGIDGKYINDSPIALTSNINNEEYTIQGRALPFDGTDVVPLNFKTDVAGDYTIAIDHVDGLFATGQDVYLVDSATGTETNLKSGAYTFSAAAGTANSRFALKYQKTLGIKAAAFSDNSVTVYKNKGTLHANSGDVAIANIKVFDIQGRLLSELKNVGSTSATIPNLKAANQVLVVKITSQDNKVVSKKVVHY